MDPRAWLLQCGPSGMKRNDRDGMAAWQQKVHGEGVRDLHQTVGVHNTSHEKTIKH